MCILAGYSEYLASLPSHLYFPMSTYPPLPSNACKPDRRGNEMALRELDVVPWDPSQGDSPYLVRLQADVARQEKRLGREAREFERRTTLRPYYPSSSSSSSLAPRVGTVARPAAKAKMHEPPLIHCLRQRPKDAKTSSLSQAKTTRSTQPIPSSSSTSRSKRTQSVADAALDSYIDDTSQSSSDPSSSPVSPLASCSTTVTKPRPLGKGSPMVAEALESGVARSLSARTSLRSDQSADALPGASREHDYEHTTTRDALLTIVEERRRAVSMLKARVSRCPRRRSPLIV